MTGIDHQPLEIRLINYFHHCIQQLFTDAPVLPTAKTACPYLIWGRWVFFQSPQSGGRSRQGTPVRNIQNTAFKKSRLSKAGRPTLPALPGKRGFKHSQARSDISCRRCDAVIRCSSFTLTSSTYHQALGLTTRPNLMRWTWRNYWCLDNKEIRKPLGHIYVSRRCHPNRGSWMSVNW